MHNNSMDMHILGNVKGGTWGKKSQKLMEGDCWKFFLRNNHNKNNPKTLSTTFLK